MLCESKSTNGAQNPPPLHPITKMNLLGVGKVGNNSSDSIKITENPDSAVITPIPKKDEVGQPEKRKKTISNILRNSGEKRMKKQNLKPTPDNSMDMTYSIESPEVTDQDKDKKLQSDDDITLIKVVQSQEKSNKAAASPVTIDDDIKIEMIKTPASNCSASEARAEKKSDNNNKSSNRTETKEVVNGAHHNDPNFDATKALEWKDGVGSLPGSTIKVILLLLTYKLLIPKFSSVHRSLFFLFFFFFFFLDKFIKQAKLIYYIPIDFNIILSENFQ